MFYGGVLSVHNGPIRLRILRVEDNWPTAVFLGKNLASTNAKCERGCRWVPDRETPTVYQWPLGARVRWEWSLRDRWS